MGIMARDRMGRVLQVSFGTGPFPETSRGKAGVGGNILERDGAGLMLKYCLLLTSTYESITFTRPRPFNRG